jgi:hypothetical protein
LDLLAEGLSKVVFGLYFSGLPVVGRLFVLGLLCLVRLGLVSMFVKELAVGVFGLVSAKTWVLAALLMLELEKLAGLLLESVWVFEWA